MYTRHRLSPLRKKLHSDVAIVGAGVAGLTAALTAADAGGSVLVLAKGAVDSETLRTFVGAFGAPADMEEFIEAAIRGSLEDDEHMPPP